MQSTARNESTKDKPLCARIWNEVLFAKYPNFEQREKWTLLYKICFKCIEDNEYVWFQYHILFKILGTKEYLGQYL